MRIFIAWIGCLLVAGSHIKGELAERNAKPRYREEIQPILAHHCYKCHARGKAKGGFSMDTRDSFLKGGDSGPVVEVGAGGRSRLIEMVSGVDPENIMPPKEEEKPLAEDQVALLKAWIDGGLDWSDPKKARPYQLQLRRVSLPPGEGHPIDRLLGSANLELVDDRLFARRVWLDSTGLLPPSKELASFLQEKDSGKKERLVRRLLKNNEAFSGHWMSFWSDHLRIGSLLDSAAFDNDNSQLPRRWLEEKLRQGTRFDLFVSNFISGEFLDQYSLSIAPKGEVASPVARAEMQNAQIIAQVFLGVRLQCAACHDSFVDRWTQREAWGFASALGEEAEIVRCEIGTGVKSSPQYLFPELGAIEPSWPIPEKRRRVAEMMVSRENGLFARTIVNRLWARFFGRGLVEPVDEMMEQEPWNADLLEWLAEEFQRRNYDLKEMIACIMSSRAYQAKTDITDDAKAFRGPLVRRLTAEQFVDALLVLSSEDSSENGVAAKRAWQENNDSLMRSLGRPDRNVITTTRSDDSFPLQAMELMNGERLNGLVKRAAKQVLNRTPAVEAFAKELYLRLLSREPTAGELAGLNSAASSFGEDEAADLLWAMLMLPEFQFIR